MEKYISKSALVAEIKKIKSYIGSDKYLSDFEKGCNFGREDVCDSLLNFIDTLEMKEVDLDYIKKELDEAVRIYKPNGDFGWGTLYNVATHFFELGLKVQKGE